MTPQHIHRPGAHGALGLNVVAFTQCQDLRPQLAGHTRPQHRRDDHDLRAQAGGPANTPITMVNGSTGRDSTTSTMRMSTESTTPRAYPRDDTDERADHSGDDRGDDTDEQRDAGSVISIDSRSCPTSSAPSQ